MVKPMSGEGVLVPSVALDRRPYYFVVGRGVPYGQAERRDAPRPVILIKRSVEFVGVREIVGSIY